MGRKQKKLKNRLRKQNQQSKSKSPDVRETKHDTIKQMNGWRIKDTDWEQRVSSNIDKLIKEMKRGYKIDEETTSVLTETVIKRVGIYQEIAELTGVPLTRGEAMWAIQYEFIFQRQLFKQDTLTVEARRDVNVHNLKYIIEQTYNRHGNPTMEELKQKVYDETEVTSIPETDDKAELEKVYTEILIEEYDRLKDTLAQEQQ